MLHDFFLSEEFIVDLITPEETAAKNVNLKEILYCFIHSSTNFIDTVFDDIAGCLPKPRSNLFHPCCGYFFVKIVILIINFLMKVSNQPIKPNKDATLDFFHTS